MRLRVWWMVLAALWLAAGCGGESSSSTSDADDTATVDTGEESDTGEIVITYDTVSPDTVPVDTYVPPQPGEFGYTCDSNSDCNSGWCIQTADGRQCTRTCVEECPQFYDCREAPGTDATYICVPSFTHLCDPCEETADCNADGQTGNYCLSYGESGKFCGGACNNEADCPGGYVCRLVPVGGGGQARQCVPPDGTQCHCSPLAKALQLSTTCFIENDNGKCEGKRFCTQGGLNSCDAADPYPESCNGADDNCNGIVDDFPPNYQCFITGYPYGEDQPEHACPGQGTCVEGVETCVGEAPKPEQCNLIDDDCDGETDEGLCDDQNPCTHDFCNDDGNCEHTNDNTLLCDDGNVCTQVDKCEDGFCKGFNPLPCGDGNVCFDYHCDPVAGCLSEYANGAACEDGQPCTINDKCNQGVCVPGSWDTCDDANSCTNDSCVANQGCTHTNVTNGLPCGGQSGQCTVGQCISGSCMGVATNEGGTCNPGTSMTGCQQGVCRSGSCNVESRPNGYGCIASSKDCPTGQCNGGVCLSTPGINCTAEYDVDLCNSVDVNGVCTASGECNVSQAPPGFTCPGCAGICLVCFGIQLCLPF
ncbi:MAG: hypothetical protein EP329_09585 [Deltaproteobacteria bacterium]|nr:MAG: hypothetical protein EP329_09585 [Deltaproteobacteria bacterium]